jgi:O-antigen ligase
MASLSFFVSTVVSILASHDVERSVRLSIPLLPALLLFVLISGHFQTLQHVRQLYLTFSLVGLSVATGVLWTAWQAPGASPERWVAQLGSSVLLVANDAALLGVIAPLSFVLFVREPRSIVGLLAAASILVSICVVSVLQSRTALVTMIVSMTSVAALLRMRVAFLYALAIVILALVVDWVLDLPLGTKFRHIWTAGFNHMWDTRFSVWGAAWAMFRDAPIVGHGPHTFVYTSPSSVRMTWAHNLYLEVLAERGVVGLVTLGLLLGSGISVARRTYRVATDNVRILLAGSLAALIGFCVAAAFESTFIRVWVTTILFALLGVVGYLTSVRETCDPGEYERKHDARPNHNLSRGIGVR